MINHKNVSITWLRRLHAEGILAGAVIAAALIIFLAPPTLFAPASANAYSIDGSGTPAAPGASGAGSGAASLPAIPAIQNGGLNSLFAPFENFFQSMTSMAGSTGGQGLGSGSLPASVTNNPAVNNGVRGALQGFDEWLYGLAGFHILGLFAALLNILAWILGLVKSIVDWLLHLIGY